jgi:hypothetical protein
MTLERMLELVLLNHFDAYLKTLTDDEVREISQQYNLHKMVERSKELSNDFLKDYIIDNPSKEVEPIVVKD